MLAHRLPIRVVFVAAAIALSAVGCGQKLTYDRWEQLRIGDSTASVRRTLGKPLVEQPGQLSYVNQKEGIAVELVLDPATGKLLFTQWADPIHGVRAKGNPPTQ